MSDEVDENRAGGATPERLRPRPPVETLIGRALRLRCPRCGEGRLFHGWFTMPERCSSCHLKYERGPGYFLGSTYFNYGFTALVLLAAYMLMHFGVGWTNRQLTPYLLAFCIISPLITFRYARALWLAMDCNYDKSIMNDQSTADDDA